jgi:hypothetical protein
MPSKHPVLDRMMVAGAYRPVRVLVEVSPQQWRPGTTGRIANAGIEVALDGEYGVSGRPRYDVWHDDRVVLAPVGACGLDHAALLADDVAWSRLDYLGIQYDEHGAPEFECRNCVCHSTIYREIRNAVRSAS